MMIRMAALGSTVAVFDDVHPMPDRAAEIMLRLGELFPSTRAWRWCHRGDGLWRIGQDDGTLRLVERDMWLYVLLAGEAHAAVMPTREFIEDGYEGYTREMLAAEIARQRQDLAGMVDEVPPPAAPERTGRGRYGQS